MDWSPIVNLLVGLLVGGGSAYYFFSRGYSVRAREVDVFGIKISLIRFEDLSVFKVFDGVTMHAINGSQDEALQESVIGKNPKLLIAIGWDIVCDAYIDKFQEYPDNESLNRKSKELGSQNIDFIKTFRDFSNQSLSKKVSFEIAKAYCFRCPSLADRISPENNSLHLKKLSSQIKELPPYEIRKAYEIFKYIDRKK